jgi:hypothetical protein
MSERVFTSEEIERILKRAMSRSADYGGGITESELLKIASELNLSKEQVLRAIREDSETAGFEEAKKMWIAKKRGSFKEHLIAYSIVNSLLLILNIYLTSSVNWAIFPILGWGIGLAFDYVDSYHTSEEKIEAGAIKLMKSNKWKKLFENFGFRILEGLQKK